MEKINKIFNFLKSQSRQTKILFAISLVAQIIYTIYESKYMLYLLNQGMVGLYFARIFASFTVLFGVTLIISLALGLLPYYIFKDATVKPRKDLNYIAIAFIIVSAIIIWGKYKTENTLHLQDYYQTIPKLK